MAADISMCPGVDSASKNEYHDIPGGTSGWCVRVTTLPPSCAECLVIWSLNRPEPSGPHRPVIGVAFLLKNSKLQNCYILTTFLYWALYLIILHYIFFDIFLLSSKYNVKQ